MKKIIDAMLFEFTKILMVYSITMTITGLMWYEISYVKLFAIIIITYTALSLVTHNIKFLLVSIVSMSSLMIIGYVILVLSNNLLDFISKINIYIELYNDAIVKGSLLEVKDQIIPITIIAFIICLIVILISKCRYYFIGLFVTGLAAFLTASFVRGYYNVTGFYIFIVALITNYFYYFYTKNIKNKDKQGFYLLAVNSILFSIILVFLAGNLYRIKPQPLIFLYDIGTAVEKYIDNIKEKNARKKESDESGGQNGDNEFNREEKDEEAVEYESADILKPKVETTSKSLLYVYTDHPIYLRGSVCNIFNGKQWDYYVNYNFEINDMEEHIFGLKYLTRYIRDDTVYKEYRDVANSFFDEEKVGIIYKNIATNILFTPTNFISIYDSNGNNSNDVFRYDASEIARYNKVLGKDFTCSINYLKPKYNLEMFQNMLRRSKEGLYDSFGNSSHKEDLIYKARKIRQEYMQIPDGTTDRTIELADNITKGYNNDYDKAKAIEIYLKSNIDYSYSTDLPDDGEDIIDNFLFETKEGFCTYSATSMVIMLRSVGIPARYVKGFVIREKEKEDADNIVLQNNNKKQEESKNNKRTVTGYNAHAWVEAYLEGYGWLPFEPTSGFNFVQETKKIDYLKKPQTDIEDTKIDDLTNKNVKEKKIPTSYIIIFLITLKLVISVLLITSRLRKHKRFYEISTTPNKIIKLFTKILMLMELVGYKTYSNQTIREYAKSINGQLDVEGYNLMELTKIYEIACYSNEVIEDDKLELFEGYYEVIKNIAKKKSNIIVVGLKLFIYNMK
ncbi:transglutaminase-like domain-containing protein [Vallitalea guaymasensis]|uniref:Transglutaminase domain-containing protein n=1 Tax=Vallitalea guaymasensis TaxID=1185412 RepID=A0A8J8SDF2_9FIRM|nr:transglutaminase-like domain-containing protein [Vallitalea guaymasensis]QUH30669.1 transglutaminase domain-containing protein [Vallitalea guaymasensis]